MSKVLKEGCFFPFNVVDAMVYCAFFFFFGLEGYHDDWQLVVELTMELESKRRMEEN